jgi:glycosyltransferase involved in cell wall biosynthesis
MPTFERIEWMPPTISLIETLADMGHEVVYITVYPDGFFEGRRQDNRIRNVSLWKKDLTLQDRIRYIRGISGALFRLDVAVKKLVCNRLGKVIKELLDENSLLWVVNEMTVMLAGSRFLKGKNYAFTVYELHENCYKARHIRRASQMAKVTVVPEYCRAHIMQSRYGLKKTPIVLPNKTDIKVADAPLSVDAQAAVDLLQQRQREGKCMVLYMGGINEERPLEPILEAIKDSDRFRLAIMGRESVYLDKLRREYEGQFDYLGAFRPPEHIQVAGYAHIGLLMYVSINQTQGLNALFCAPNKLYEYTEKGLPVITNDIPGLRFPVMMNQIGCAVDFQDSNAVRRALESIEENYEMYAENAVKFSGSVDPVAITREILQAMEKQEMELKS